MCLATRTSRGARDARPPPHVSQKDRDTTVDGRNIQTLSTTRTPPTPKLNVRGLARMFRRMDETNQTLETQIQSSYVQH